MAESPDHIIGENVEQGVFPDMAVDSQIDVDTAYTQRIQAVFRNVESLRAQDVVDEAVDAQLSAMAIDEVSQKVGASIIHVMYDGYGGDQEKLADVERVYALCHALAKELKIGERERLHVLPYFHNPPQKVLAEPLDSGVSALYIYPRGHFTVHTFDKKGTVFVDFATLGEHVDAPTEIIQNAMRNAFAIDRDESFLRGKNPIDDPSKIPEAFGPHVTLEGQLSSDQLTLDWMYDFLERMPKAIGMTPIAPPAVISSVDKQGRMFRDGMAVIAESHITLHADETGKVFFDIFSCKAFDVENFLEWAKSFGLNFDMSSFTLAARGKDFPRPRQEERRG